MKERLLFHLIRILTMRKITKHKNTVYITFDDGPEPDITEFILKNLKEYGFKATFFCVGQNVNSHKELFDKIKGDGHSIGSHTYSHISSLSNSCAEYINDVKKAAAITDSFLFRPPWGVVNLQIFRKLYREGYKIVLWNASSSDTLDDSFDLNKALESLKRSTKDGSVVLFHFCKKHEKETKQILPEYLKYLDNIGFKSIGL